MDENGVRCLSIILRMPCLWWPQSHQIKTEPRGDMQFCCWASATRGGGGRRTRPVPRLWPASLPRKSQEMMPLIGRLHFCTVLQSSSLEAQHAILGAVLDSSDPRPRPYMVALRPEFLQGKSYWSNFGVHPAPRFKGLRYQGLC